MKARKSTNEPDLDKTNGATRVCTPPHFIQSWAAAYGIAAAVAISLFAGSLPFFLSHYLGSQSCDMNIAYRHFLSFGTRWLRQGVWPQWNPHIFCGTPFLPGMCGAMLSPVNLPCLLTFPQPLSINLAILIHAIVLATGGVYWARQHGLGPMGGALAGCLCVAGSALANRVFAGHFTIVSTMAWIPWLLALHERILQGHRRSALPLGVVAALMVYSGHLQLCYYAAVLSALMYVVALISQTRTERSAWFLRTLKLHSFALAVAFGLSAIELLPVLDTVRFSARTAARDLSWVRRFSMPLENYFNLIAPNFLGARLQYAGRWFWWEVAPYLGVGALLLALLGAVRSTTERQRWPLLALVVGSFVLAGAPDLPVLGSTASMLPGWTLFRGHAKILIYGMLGAAILAAVGFESLSTLSKLQFRILLGLGCGVAVIAALGLAGVWFPFFTKFLSSTGIVEDRVQTIGASQSALAKQLYMTLRSAATLSFFLCVLFVSLLILSRTLKHRAVLPLFFGFLVLDPWLLSWRTANERFPVAQPPPLSAIGAYARAQSSPGRIEVPGIGLVNAGMSVEAEAVGGNDVSVSRYYDTFVNAYRRVRPSEPNLHTRFDWDSPLMDIANLTTIVLPRANEVSPNVPLTLSDTVGEWNFWQRKTVLPRAYVVSRAIWVPDREDAIQEALERGADFHREVLLVGRAEEDQPSTTAVAEAVPATLQYFGLHRVEVHVPTDGYLVLADAYYPHWEASRNGEKIPVYRANGMFRGVHAKAGDMIVFEYRNRMFLAGAIVSGISWLLILALVAKQRIWGKRQDPPSSL